MQADLPAALRAARLVLLLSLVAPGLAGSASPTDNPPAPGFDLEGSDPAAIALADRVMERLGGRQAWDETRYLTWSFFGRRRHVWDKHSGDVRIEGTDRDSGEPYTVLMSLHSKRGRAWQGGEEVTDPETLAQMLDSGEAAWINDSYWMFMPYKLKDTGVTLRHLGAGQMLDGRPAQVLQLTFQDVGRTPQNKYRVYVAEDTALVEQWDFFASADDAEPRFQNPWHDWRRYGEILLSGNRGDSGHTDIAVFDELPENVLHDPAPVDWSALLP